MASLLEEVSLQVLGEFARFGSSVALDIHTMYATGLRHVYRMYTVYIVYTVYNVIYVFMMDIYYTRECSMQVLNILSSIDSLPHLTRPL